MEYHGCVLRRRLIPEPGAMGYGEGALCPIPQQRCD